MLLWVLCAILRCGSELPSSGRCVGELEHHLILHEVISTAYPTHPHDSRSEMKKSGLEMQEQLAYEQRLTSPSKGKIRVALLFPLLRCTRVLSSILLNSATSWMLLL